MSTTTHPVVDQGRPAEVPTTVKVPFGRRLAITGLVVGAGLNTAQALIAQFLDERPDTVTARIAWANANETGAWAAALAGVLAVAFMAIGFVAAAHVLRQRARKTGATAAGFLLIGMWGFFAIEVAELFELAAMLDPEGEPAAQFLDSLAEHPLIGVLFGVPFLVFAPLGVLVLTIGALLKGGMPRWVAAAWLAFIVLDFTIGAVGPVDPHWLYFIGAVGLAVHIGRGTDGAWANAGRPSNLAPTV
jgi:hypothetical protein